MLLAQGFYSNPVPGFIVTAIVCGICIFVAVVVAVRNFGPAAKRRAASEAWNAAVDSPAGPAAPVSPAPRSRATTTAGAQPPR